jgi:hypothetical protein
VFGNTGSGGVGVDAQSVAFFTEMARRGIQEQTNWTADTYKTIVNINSSKGGWVFAYIGCTAGGAETHTTRWTIDGKTAQTVTVAGLASGERAVLLSGASTTSTAPGNEALDADKATFGAIGANNSIATWAGISNLSIPLLRFEQTLLLEAKHSVSITNSTATAYSALQYRLGLTA